MVLDTEITTPTARLGSTPQPSSPPVLVPMAMKRSTASGPPSSAIHLTRMRSRTENSRPMENMSSTTPISAKRSNERGSLTEGPGVKGLMSRPPKT